MEEEEAMLCLQSLLHPAATPAIQGWQQARYTSLTSTTPAWTPLVPPPPPPLVDDPLKNDISPHAWTPSMPTQHSFCCNQNPLRVSFVSSVSLLMDNKGAKGCFIFFFIISCLAFMHANGASMFFIVVYMHIFRYVYYGSIARCCHSLVHALLQMF